MILIGRKGVSARGGMDHNENLLSLNSVSCIYQSKRTRFENRVVDHFHRSFSHPSNRTFFTLYMTMRVLDNWEDRSTAKRRRISGVDSGKNDPTRPPMSYDGRDSSLNSINPIDEPAVIRDNMAQECMYSSPLILLYK